MKERENIVNFWKQCYVEMLERIVSLEDEKQIVRWAYEAKWVRMFLQVISTSILQEKEQQKRIVEDKDYADKKKAWKSFLFG